MRLKIIIIFNFIFPLLLFGKNFITIGYDGTITYIKGELSLDYYTIKEGGFKYSFDDVTYCDIIENKVYLNNGKDITIFEELNNQYIISGVKNYLLIDKKVLIFEDKLTNLDLVLKKYNGIEINEVITNTNSLIYIIYDQSTENFFYPLNQVYIDKIITNLNTFNFSGDIYIDEIAFIIPSAYLIRLKNGYEIKGVPIFFLSNFIEWNLKEPLTTIGRKGLENLIVKRFKSIIYSGFPYDPYLYDSFDNIKVKETLLKFPQCKLLLLQKLDFSELNIEKIPKIDKFINLRYLKLDNNSITTIENISGLIFLKELYLNNNNITKIQGLDNLINLEVLYLNNNKISHIENLDKLIKLKRLDLYNNEITKITGLTNLKNLIILALNNNKISKIEGLSNLSKLSCLYLYENSISVIEGLNELTNLNFLFLNNNNISKITGLEKLKNLVYLYLNDNQIEKIENLEFNTNLQRLYIYNNPLRYISKESYLFLKENKVKIYIDNNEFTDIDKFMIKNRIELSK